MYDIFYFLLQVSRLSTFFTGRKRKSLDGLIRAQSDHLAEVELGLNGLQRALAIEAGHDLHRVKLESFGTSTNSKLPGGSVNIRKGASKLIERLKKQLDKESIKLSKCFELFAKCITLN